ncbi:MAG: hypothetical protein L3J82_04005 [Planctomycetes bacterium]|nr:hypothetical protein [Planctomycetota bacterium]
MKCFSLLLLISLSLLVGCNDGDGKGGGSTPPQPIPASAVIGPESGGSADPDGGTPAALTITGKITFERLPVSTGGLGATPSLENAANVAVEAVAHDDINNVLASGMTDSNGDYSIAFSTDADYYIRARSTSGTAGNIDTVYHSQTVPQIAHAVSSGVQNRATGDVTVNIQASHNLPDNRAGAFAVLDTVQRLRNNTDVAAVFPNLGPLDVFWGPNNYGTQFLKSGSGQTITLTSFTDLNGPNSNPTIYLLGGGDPDDDHDEYDESVIAHEWASFLQLTQSRDNNFGGPHSGEEILFSSAYSEGVVTAIGNGLLNQQWYLDTQGYPDGGTSSVAFAYDLESGTVPGTGVGYGNEFEVSRAVWDFIDGGTGGPTDGDADPSNISMQGFLSSFADLKNRSGSYEIVWLASLLQELVDDTQVSVADANTVMTAHSAAFPPAGGANSFAPEIMVGGATLNDALDAHSGATPNIILGPQANAVYKLVISTASTITIDLTNTTAGYAANAHRLDLTIHAMDRQIIGADQGSVQNKQIIVTLQPGVYQIRVQHLPANQGVSASSNFDLAVS